MPKIGMAELEAQIGIMPHTQGPAGEKRLKDLLSNPSESFSVQTALKTWLVLNGIPQKAANAATGNSMINAYCHRNYLRSWRSRVNPSWDLLGNTDVDEVEPAVAPNPIQTSAQTPAAPQGLATQPTAMSRVEADAFLKQIFGQINITTDKLLTEKLRDVRVQLSDQAKAEIVQLATDTARATFAELMPPRTIEVRNLTTGSSVNVGHQHEQFPLLLSACQARDHKGFRLNIWLTGPTGSGKTTAAENVAKALQLDFGSDGSLDADYKVLGFRDANGNIISTQFLRLYANGGVYVADEIDNWMSSATLCMNAALGNGWVSTPGGLIQRHKDFVVIACANTWGLGATSDYVGRNKLDAASLDRFQPKIDWPYDEKLERTIANGMDPLRGKPWCDIVQTARTKAKAQGLKIIVSPRATFNGLALLAAGFDAQAVADMTLAAGISPEQKRSIGLDAVRLAPAAPNITSAPDYEAVPRVDKDLIDDEAMEFWSQGKQINAIKHVRQYLGMDLAQAKNYCENMATARGLDYTPAYTY